MYELICHCIYLAAGINCQLATVWC